MHTAAKDTSHVDPPNLRGLLQAVYVADCLCKGDTVSDLVAKFDGDAQIVDMWINFLEHNHWLLFDAGKWTMTNKGLRYAYDLTREAIEYGSPPR